MAAIAQGFWKCQGFTFSLNFVVVTNIGTRLSYIDKKTEERKGKMEKEEEEILE